MEAHLDQMADLVQKLSSELRSGFRPAIDNFIGFFHAIDWTEPWSCVEILWAKILCLCINNDCVRDKRLMALYEYLVEFSEANLFYEVMDGLAGVYLAERINGVMGDCWRSFASQNYFDPHGVFLSVVWSGPLLIIATIILMNSLFSLCYMIVRWKRAELRHRARLARENSNGVKHNLGSVTLPCTPVILRSVDSIN
ncbi:TRANSMEMBRANE PROTEIN 18 [Salix purpurea]|uniref:TRANSMEMBRANE PROTEIN 18 n=1 Tax=Salix purpurea TaxID=77065 RepID=A0A9Q0V9V8_SALPP|nr:TRANSMEMBRANE PROTEIN 18 [Salix purpurea]